MLGVKKEVRAIIVHYHLFKNGGSSIEKMLKACYGDQWETYDKDDPGARISALEMQTFIESRPALKAVSSHQLVPPNIEGDLCVMPVIFLRHPLVRVRSAYLFEWQKQLSLDAPKGSLTEYIREKFKNRSVNVISNFQVSRLCNQNYNDVRLNRNLNSEQMLRNSKLLIDSLPAFGLVEKFTDSLQLLRTATSHQFPELELTEYRENVLQFDNNSIDSRIAQLKEEIGIDLFDELTARNSLDLQLHSYAEGRFNRMLEEIDSNEPQAESGFFSSLLR